MRFITILFLHFSLLAVDFDCVIVGTSPFSLFEALHQHHLGKRVLILEESPQCGGAWKSITVCGVRHVDMGCHQIGHNYHLKSFLEEYAGCKIVSLDNPLQPFDHTNSPNGYYFSQGCFELIDNLVKLIEATNITLMLNHKMETLSVDAAKTFVTIQTKDYTFTTNKLILTPMSCCSVNSQEMITAKSKYFHLYLLIQDPNPPLFSYRSGIIPNVSRLMNLTHFLEDLKGTGRQLIIIQTHNEQHLSKPQDYLDRLKSEKLVDQSAFLLNSEQFIYEAAHLNQGMVFQLGGGDLIEILQTGHIQSLANYLPKWKQTLRSH